jgi:outer membrane receptor protein involved in Fe transport
MGAPARAATAKHVFSIPSKPVAAALVDFAVQAQVSIGDGGACTGSSRPLVGRYSAPEGLARLLAGTGCTYRQIDDGAFRVVRAPPPPARERVAASPKARAAQPSATGEPPPLRFSEVIITGLRRELAEGRVSASVSLVTSERLRILGGRDERDAARQVAGVAMTNLGMGRDKIMIRGLSDGAFTGRTQSAVGTYLDETPITYNAPDPDLYLADVDRVEILKGPQGALYGGGSLGGVFRIVTRQPMLGETSALLRAGRSFTDSGSPGRLFEGAGNLPLGEKAAVRLVGYSELRGGYFDDPTHSNPDQIHRDGGRAALLVQIAPDWRLNLGAAMQEISSADAHYATETPNNARWRRWRANRIAESHKNRFSTVSATVEGVGDWGKLQSTTTFVHHAFASRYDASNAVSVRDNAEALGIFDEPSRTEMLVEDATYLSPVGRPVQWLAGVFVMRSREETSPQLFALKAATGVRSNIYSEQRLDRRQEFAAYGELSYTFARDWTLAVGGRAFRSLTRTHSDVAAVGKGASRSFEGEHVYQGFSPKIALSYAHPSGALLYLLASQGYRAGGFNTGGFFTPNRLRRYSPDRLWNTEFGGKIDLMAGRLRLREAVFYDIWSNIQTDAFDGDGLAFTYNVGRGTSLGLEAEARFQATRRLVLRVNALLTRTTLSRVFGPQPTYRESLPGAPRASFNALALWERPLRDFGTFRLGGEASYVGSSHVTFDRMSLPASGDYVTGRVFMELRTGRWALGGYLDNPTNSTADTFAYGNPFSFGQVRQATPLRPRTLRATLTAEF